MWSPCAVNRPMALASQGVAARLTITAVPSGPGASIARQDELLTVHDAPDLASCGEANVVWSAPLAALVANMTVDLGTTSDGLTFGAVPPGVAAVAEFG
jgi:hypothetical protein